MIEENQICMWNHYRRKESDKELNYKYVKQLSNLTTEEKEAKNRRSLIFVCSGIAVKSNYQVQTESDTVKRQIICV